LKKVPRKGKLSKTTTKVFKLLKKNGKAEIKRELEKEFRHPIGSVKERREEPSETKLKRSVNARTIGQKII
jgi:hypothetical protein